MNIYIGNLNPNTTEDQVRKLFSEHGRVTTVKIIEDIDGTSKGFGFVEMDEDRDAAKAIKKLNGSEMMGQNIEVSEAQPKKANANRFITESREKQSQQRNSGPKRR